MQQIQLIAILAQAVLTKFFIFSKKSETQTIIKRQ